MKDKLISDRQVIKAILDNKELFRFAEDIQRFAVIIEDLPSMDRPRGEWIIEKDVNGNTYGRCSICGMRQYAGQLNFCPDCGAKMKGIDDE